MKLSEAQIKRFKELDALVKSGKASSAEKAEAKKLAQMIKRVGFKKRPVLEGKTGSNDISWYNKYPDLLKDASNIIFNEVAGTKFNASVKATANNIEYPLVGAKFTILPTIGKCLDANHPFNYQMRDLWLKLHRAYRGVGTYEYADLGIGIFSIMAVFADIARAERIYALCSKFARRNRSFPSVILTALGLDPTAVSASHLADFRYQINRCVSKAGILCLPKGFSAFELYIRLAGNIFADSEDVRAQWYFYDNEHRLDYDPTFSTGGSITYTARTHTGGGSTQTFDDIINDINTQLDNLLSDTDIARMCSDILKAFGDNGVVSLEMLPENYEIDPVVDDVRKLQLHNSTLVGRLAGGDFSSTIMTALGAFTHADQTLRIYQEGGVVKQSLFALRAAGTAALTPSGYKVRGSTSVPTIVSGVQDSFNYGIKKLNCWKSEPTGDDIVEMTRQSVAHNLVSFVDSGTSYQALELDAYSIYVVTGMVLYRADPNGYALPTTYRSNYGAVASLTSAMAFFELVGHLSRLDWAPQFHVLDVSGGSSPTTDYEFWDTDNYTLISKESLARIHDACVLSLFKLEASPASN